MKTSDRRRIPPPPVVRDEVVIERVDDRSDRGSDGPRRRNRRSSNIDVSDVKFSGVSAATAKKMADRLAEAAGAFEAERFTEAGKLLDSIDRITPGVAEVYELRGLTRYRLGLWQQAIADLERFHGLTGSVEQHPVWADCYRALERWHEVEELWRELGDASPSAGLVEEGRIVQAGALADRGKLDDAIRLLDRAPRVPPRPSVHHLRRWYALADLHERVGDLARARRVFGDIVTAQPDFGDAAERMASLG